MRREPRRSKGHIDNSRKRAGGSTNRNRASALATARRPQRAGHSPQATEQAAAIAAARRRQHNSLFGIIIRNKTIEIILYFHYTTYVLSFSCLFSWLFLVVTSCHSVTRELRTIGTFPISALRPFCTVAFLYCGILHCGFLHCGFSAQCPHAGSTGHSCRKQELVSTQFIMIGIYCK